MKRKLKQKIIARILILSAFTFPNLKAFAEKTTVPSNTLYTNSQTTAEKLNFTQAKNKFKTVNETVSYFILVECYKKYLDSTQKNNFLNADTTDDMLSILDEKQLKHLTSLLEVFRHCCSGTAFDYGMFNLYNTKLDRYSDWFKENVINNSELIKSQQIDIQVFLPPYSNYGSETSSEYNKCIQSLEAYNTQPPEQLISQLCNTVCKKLIDNIQKKYNKQTKKDLINKYKSRLKNFDGDSMEYRQWLILLFISREKSIVIPSIHKIYDVTKLLKQLDYEKLEKLEKMLKECNINQDAVKDFEPYFCQYSFQKDSKNESENTPEYILLSKIADLKKDKVKKEDRKSVV